MNRFLFLITFFLFALTACHKDHIVKVLPSCMQDRIQVFSKQACEKEANVKEYTFQGKTVFVFNPGICLADASSEVIDTDCKTIGYLGGLMGTNAINGEDFSHAIFLKTVWER